MTTSLDDLLERLERAMGPSRELANDVLLACGWTMQEVGNNLCDPALEWTAPDGDSCYDGDQPNPLESIDAALTLIPEDIWWLFAKGRTHPNEPLYGIQLYRKGDPVEMESFVECEHEIPGICVCIAALRARSQS